jgi:hypothetical protein
VKSVTHAWFGRGEVKLDPVPAGAHRVDELADQRRRGSSSLAKKIEAAFRISLASFQIAILSPQAPDLGQFLAARPG